VVSFILALLCPQEIDSLVPCGQEAGCSFILALLCPQEIDSLVPCGQEAGRAPELVWLVLKRKKSHLPGIGSSFLMLSSP